MALNLLEIEDKLNSEFDSESEAALQVTMAETLNHISDSHPGRADTQTILELLVNREFEREFPDDAV